LTVPLSSKLRSWKKLSRRRLESRLSILKEAILAKRLNVFDCLEHYKLDDIYDGTRREQQIKCPGFHGDDRRKSARIYETGTMFCWACDKSYDIFEFEIKYTGLSFAEVVYQLAQRHDIELTFDPDDEDSPPPALAEIKDLFKSFEARKPVRKFEDHLQQIAYKLVQARDSLSLDDYQKYWYVVDQISWRVTVQQMLPEEALKHLDSVYKEFSANRV